VSFRVRNPEGGYRWFLSRAEPIRTSDGTLLYWIGVNLDIEERKQTELCLTEGQLAPELTSSSMIDDLRESKARLEEAQRVAHVGHWEWDLETDVVVWSDETYRIFGLRPQERPMDLATVRAMVHPEDRESLYQGVDDHLIAGVRPDAEFRIVLPSGEVRTVHALTSKRWSSIPGDSKKDATGRPYKLFGTVQDITERKRAERALQRTQAHFREGQRLARMGSWTSDGADCRWSDELYKIYGFDQRDSVPTTEQFLAIIHSQDRAAMAQAIKMMHEQHCDCDLTTRIIRPDGELRYVRCVGIPLIEQGVFKGFLGVGIDVTEQEQLTEELRRSAHDLRERERELQQMLDYAPQLVAVFGPNHERFYVNRIALDYLGVTLDEWRQNDSSFDVHPDDLEPFYAHADRAFSTGSAHEFELRLRKGDGSYRWVLARYNPLRDDQGQVMRWYVACADIEDRKRAEERLRQENVALREELDNASMFEEIVGTSPALKAVLSRVSKVAGSDSTVLLTGETGTGKELIARAVHKRSQRSERAFVSVNCAALAPSLITSELFGYEKGAFTGATQRRLGRFELADGGTIFLDEVGELSPDVQVALLRVLQEREFERVGGTQPIHVDVRVIAATNRDLKAAVANGAFRQDLFYRLNVFPIEVPPLRERKPDLLMLVEYFVQRYASRAGKTFHSIDKKTIDLLQSYDWPGNIRELQNIIERSVILSSGEGFSVDESWLSKEVLPPASPIEASAPFIKIEPGSEREIIEAALAETRGRVSGPLGAAARLGIPPSTLDHRIKALEIDKRQFKYR
jgi:PAS domain S-box-containing protein